MEEWARKEVAATTEQGGSHAVIDLLRSERNEGVDLSSSPLIAPAPPPPSVIGDSQPRRLSLLSHFSFSSDLSEADAEWEKDETVRALRIELGLEDKVLVSMSAEDRMKLAIEAVDQGDYLAPAAASRYGVDVTTMRRRMKGTPPKKASNATKRRFSDPEELVIKEYGFHMCDLGHPPTLQMVTDAASTIERGKPELSQVGASV
ncbi:hypothetical protein LTR55_012294, partial [Exophiala xenobiotica]